MPHVKVSLVTSLALLFGTYGCASSLPPAADIAQLDRWAQKQIIAGTIGQGTREPFVLSTASMNDQVSIGDFVFASGEPYAQDDAIGALLYHADDGVDEVRCSATLVGKQTILTAAHCVSGRDYGRYKFATGPNAWQPNNTYAIKSGQVAKDFDGATAGKDDFALLYIDTIPQIKPLLLPSDTALTKGILARHEMLAFIGYGWAVRADGDRPRFGYKGRIDSQPRASTDFSFQYGEPGNTTCFGDSGGPAIYRATPQDTPIVVGVISGTLPKCSGLGIAGRTDSLSTWFADNVR